MYLVVCLCQQLKSKYLTRWASLLLLHLLAGIGDSWRRFTGNYLRGCQGLHQICRQDFQGPLLYEVPSTWIRTPIHFKPWQHYGPAWPDPRWLPHGYTTVPSHWSYTAELWYQDHETTSQRSNHSRATQSSVLSSLQRHRPPWHQTRKYPSNRWWRTKAGGFRTRSSSSWRRRTASEFEGNTWQHTVPLSRGARPETRQHHDRNRRVGGGGGDVYNLHRRTTSLWKHFCQGRVPTANSGRGKGTPQDEGGDDERRQP